MMLHFRTAQDVVDAVCSMVFKGSNAGGGGADSCHLKVSSGVDRCILLLNKFCCFNDSSGGVLYIYCPEWKFSLCSMMPILHTD